MLKYFILIFVFIGGILAWMYFGIGRSYMHSEAVPEPAVPHFYGDPGRSVANIHITAFYFVPKNKKDFADGNWRKIMEDDLLKLQKFHSLQFRERSHVTYDIYPLPIVGREQDIFYDTESTQGGNPRALINVSKEIENRVFNEAGDLFAGNFGGAAEGAYPVMFIMYEGVGAIGGVIYESELSLPEEIAKELGLEPSVVFPVEIRSADGFFLVNKAYLSGAAGSFGDSIFCHEFYHTLGIPNAYEITGSVSRSFSGDIMGLGRFGPLQRAYIERKTLSELGL